MKRLLFLILLLLVSFAGYSQTDNRKALLYYHDGCEKIFRKNFKGAITEFTWALMFDSVFIQAYENRGVAKYYLNDYKGAISDFNKALEINPYDYNTYGRRGWAKFHLQDCEGAIADFTKAIEGNASNYKFYIIRGQAKFYLNDYQGAIADFNKVINFGIGDRPQRSEAFFWRGLVKIDLGEKENGCLDLSKAVKLGYAKAFEIEEIYCQ